MGNQLDILSESLDRKAEALRRIQDYNAKQELCFSGEDVSLEAFDEAIEEKELLIDEITKLDQGFELLYAGLSRELEGNRDKYADRIRELQKKVQLVTELSVSVQTQEKRNKKLIEEYFARERSQLGKKRKSSKAAYDYYKNMSNSNYAAPQMYDHKN